MKYVIMCGGSYANFKVPKQFAKVRGERLVDRTIRLLRERGIKDIVITSNNPIFDSCGVPRVENKQNNFSQDKSWTNMKGWWLDAFYHFNEPCCYLFGDVCYSEKAIKTIIDAKSSTSLLFGSNPTSSEGYLIKTWYEPFAYKVFDYESFYKGIEETKELYKIGKVKRHPIAWELYRHLNNLPINSHEFEEHFICINDYTTDIDNINENEDDIQRIEYYMSKEENKNQVLSKVFGVISWIPDKEPDRSLRIERLDRMFKQIYDLFGDVNWLVIAQNWKDYKQPNYIKNIEVVHKPQLGILKARKTLREEFLKRDYDYLIMCDDDVLIEVDGPLIAQAYMDELNFHPNGFIFLQYDAAQLNMCAISKFIYEQEPMVDVDPQKEEGYEDKIFSELLHYKYPQYEFNTIHGIRCTQFQNRKEKAPSTWATKNIKQQVNWSKTCYYVNQFKKGNFVIDKNKGKDYNTKYEWYQKALWMGWCTREDYDNFMKNN